MTRTTLRFPKGGAALISLLAVTSLLAFLCASALGEIGIEKAAGKLAPNSLSEQGVGDKESAAPPAPTEAGPAPGEGTTSPTEVSAPRILSIEEEIKPKPLLLSKAEMDTLLGSDPSFIYDSGDKADPMLVPWTHVRVRSDEYRRVGEAATKAKDWRKAYENYANAVRMLDTLPASWIQMKSLVELRQKSALDLENLKRMIPPGMVLAIASQVGEARLPEWVKDNTTGLILSARDPVCLVGPYTLRVGEMIPGQDMPVVVYKIERDTVTYKVKDKLFPVKLREGE
jgi:hypothetical protein